MKIGDITNATLNQLVNRLNVAAALCDDLAREAPVFPNEQRRGTSMILAIRQWQLGAFKELERE